MSKQGIGIPAGEIVSLQPASVHIVLVNPKQRPAEGEKAKATLQFEKTGPVEVEFVVQAKTPQSAASEDHSTHSKP
ncbi:copper chaperone PCu(A)C [Neorhizobium galegae]|uniref:Copper chaperone PCu(A)C n=1 Tax=Neorhizobium galegae bv. officinalis TaxID=323656 RepID=A0A0T7GWW6_NEOGA|nr:copper chaperone PCu(A)C [Neorhizobium galegae]CDZ51637.1 Hypothetical protein NGAL_HAMBI1189_40820 [Neorhizobium galegae bv. officinalis]